MKGDAWEKTEKLRNTEETEEPIFKHKTKISIII